MSDNFLYDVFLSHNYKDKPRVRKLAERLRDAGLRVWFDEWEIRPGDLIALKVDEGLENSRVLLLCISSNALASDWVKLERSTAVHRDPANENRRFIPVLLEDCKLPDVIRRYEYVDFRQETDAAFAKLLAGLRQEPTQQRETSGPQTKSSNDNNTDPIRVIPATDGELEVIRKEFKFFSPVPGSIKQARSPTVGEQWRRELTLPSGLVLLLGERSTIDDFKNLLKLKLFGVVSTSSFDERPYLYDVVRFKAEDSTRSIQHRTTYSLAWHPNRPLLATAGDGNIPRLWDMESGKCVTRRTFWHTGSPAEAMAWSADGEMFLSGIDVVDGRTGKLLCDSGSDTYLRFSGYQYDRLRGQNTSFRGAPCLSNTNNFTPWRPFSNQIMFENYSNNLVLRNGRTGEIEQVIDCDVDSRIVDFAWHPQGRFVAVAFEAHNIRIIDLNRLKIIDDLSVRTLTGWSPDGRMLVARQEKLSDEFVCWHGPEMRERPMSEEVKDQLWFKRFSTNISADGLRFIRSIRDDQNGWKTHIFCVSTGQTLATLPVHVRAAAWSSIDGGMLATCEGSETSIWRL